MTKENQNFGFGRQNKIDELSFLNAENNSIKYARSNLALSESNFHHNLSID
jgi:hypothetical protein